MLLTIWLVTVITALYLYLRQVYSKLANNSIRHLPPVPFFGNLFWVMLKRENMTDAFMRSLNAFPGDRVVGQYELLEPMYIINDLDLIRKVTLKDFDYFVDRQNFIDDTDPLFGRNLLVLKGDEWKAMRSTLSPAFTSSKIRLMVPFMVEVGEQMIKFMKQKINESGEAFIDVEAKNIATRYANDVIATCAFGLKTDSFIDDSNSFYKMALQFTTTTFRKLLKFMAFRLSPKISKLLRLNFSEEDQVHFYHEIILGSMKHRDDNNIVRHDMIDILLQAKKGQLSHDSKDVKDVDAGFATVEESAIGKKNHDREWKDTDLVAQAVLFLFAGFETVSTAMSFMLHELAVNPNVQERLYQEIQENEKRNGGKFDYNSVQHMKYLDMVVSETMRRWPPAPFTNRSCVKPYNVGKAYDGAPEDCVIPEGGNVVIPIWAIHHNPEYYPNPTKFDPERFSQENKDLIKPLTYLPFGVGPRNCIETMLLTIWLVTVVTALYLYLRQVYSKLANAGVRHLPPVPFFGNLGWVMLKREHMLEAIMRSLKAFPNDRIVGQYDLLEPVYIINDLELVKKITLKDFDYFMDRQAFLDDTDPLFGRNLLVLKGDEWKAMRSTLSPAFTSSKIRLMVPFMMEVGEQMIKFMKQKIEESGESFFDVEGKDLATRYANDVIASCAFGLKTDSFKEDNNPFYRISLGLTTTSFRRLLVLMANKVSPYIPRLFNLRFADDKEVEFYNELILGSMKYREDNKIVRNDMIDILLQAKKGQLTHDNKDMNDVDAGFATVEESAIGKKNYDKAWTDTDLVAQAVLFLFAGFETVSTMMAFMLHELALNPDVQERLYREILENEERNDGKFDYNSVQHMKYLDMVVTETMRLWSPAAFTNRSCVKAYNVGKAYEGAPKDCTIPVGANVTIPIWAFHHNPDYFPNPKKFDPERFSPENKDNIKPFTYQPFGMGPRNCIGSRFALCEVKVMAYQLLQHFEVSANEKTSNPARLAKDGFSMKIDGGAWVRLKLR